MENKIFLRDCAIRLGGFFLAIAMAATGAAAQLKTSSAEGFDPAALKRVAYLPLARAMLPEGGGGAVCPVGHEVFVSGRIEEAAEAELSRAIGQALLGSAQPVSLVPQAEINAARVKLKADPASALLTSQGSWQLAIGKEVKADAVLLGFIYRYQDRVGSAFSITTPAALSFCLHLVDPQTGKILWSLRYEDEQLPLFANLLELPAFLHRRGRWITVAEMSEEAASAVLPQLPWNQTAAKPK